MNDGRKYDHSGQDRPDVGEFVSPGAADVSRTLD
jgi:hypothetical protein